MGSCRYRRSCEDIRQELNVGLSLDRMWLPFASTYATGMTAAESDPLRQRTDQTCSTTRCMRCLKHTHTRWHSTHDLYCLPNLWHFHRKRWTWSRTWTRWAVSTPSEYSGTSAAGRTSQLSTVTSWEPLCDGLSHPPHENWGVGDEFVY
jgi:hypothetical protein